MNYSQYLPAVASVYQYLAVLLPILALWLWLRPGRVWAQSLFESEGVASSRLVAAFIVGVGTFVFGSTWSGPFVDASYFFASSLFLAGVAGKVGSRFAQRPPDAAPTTNIAAKTVTTGDATTVTDTGADVPLPQ